MDITTNIKEDSYYTHSFYITPNKTCPHCGEILEKGTDTNKYIAIEVNTCKLAEKQKRWKFNQKSK